VVASVAGESRGAEALANWVPGRMLHVQLPSHLPLRDVERYGYQAIRELCEQPRMKPLAFVFLDDVVARGGTRALLQAGLGDGRCPVVVVVGKQEMEPYGLPVTYITHDTELEAHWAVEMLDAQVEGRDGGTEPRQSLFGVEAGDRRQESGDRSQLAVISEIETVR
jgi:DNA-binding LacI/PurR family transcriptional regulator